MQPLPENRLMFFRKSSFEFRESDFDRACAQRNKDQLEWAWDAYCQWFLQKYGSMPNVSPDRDRNRNPDRDRGDRARRLAACFQAELLAPEYDPDEPLSPDQFPLTLYKAPRPPDWARPAPRMRRYPARGRISSGTFPPRSIT